MESVFFKQTDSCGSCNSCDFGGNAPAVIPDSELSGHYLVNLGGTTITAAVAVRVEGVSLVYICGLQWSHSSGELQCVACVL